MYWDARKCKGVTTQSSIRLDNACTLRSIWLMVEKGLREGKQVATSCQEGQSKLHFGLNQLLCDAVPCTVSSAADCLQGFKKINDLTIVTTRCVNI
mmetsp:Transcript_4393/g.11539  ORF Transcript_4393/g.11539 Transcript_4393/m.11539 type:complete len:96 (+) Transcript_4393:1503-1790(+)